MGLFSRDIKTLDDLFVHQLRVINTGRVINPHFIYERSPRTTVGCLLRAAEKRPSPQVS